MPGVASLALKISAVPSLDAAQVKSLHLLHPRRQLFKKGAILIGTATAYSHAYLVCTGWAACYRLLPNGGRQLANILLPGDFAGLEGAITPTADRTVQAITAVTALAFPPDVLTTLYRTNSDLGAIALWCILQEASMVTEHLASVGRRDAYERVCHFLVELWVRLREIEACTGDTFAMPVSLHDMSDALGLSEVHLSRTVQRLRTAALFEVQFHRRQVRLLNPLAAARLCGFDPAYLKLRPRHCHELTDIQPQWGTA